jgi:aminoglycoside/choline kinase family phosphotransferase
MQSDGSTRRFWRVRRDGSALCVVAAPAGTSEKELAESRSAWKIGNHLQAKGVAVPKLYGWDSATGLLVFEDLGDVRLYDQVRGVKADGRLDTGALCDLYRASLEQLAVMQFAGAEGFDPDWCWDGRRYDVELMLDRDSGYFLRAFWQGLLGREVVPGIALEFRDIAAHAGRAPAGYFLHRDFQSRNIMVQEDRLRFIDFQGGRLGPLGYDVASLLIDPYAALPLRCREELLAFYGQLLARRLDGEAQEFFISYNFLALQRNLQIVGAFAFLSKVRGKVFFAGFIEPALLSLQALLANRCFADYRGVRNLVDQGLAGLRTGSVSPR